MQNIRRGDGPGPHPPDERPLRILVVDDNEEIVRTLALLLSRLGHQIQVATTLAAARQAGTDFDLLIADVSLPDGSGLTLMRELGEKTHVRGIALTGHVSSEDRRAAADAGFGQHLRKPVSFDSLLEAIRHVMRA